MALFDITNSNEHSATILGWAQKAMCISSSVKKAVGGISVPSRNPLYWKWMWSTSSSPAFAATRILTTCF